MTTSPETIASKLVSSKLGFNSPSIITRPRKVIPHSIDRRAEEVLASLVHNPALLQLHMKLGRILAIRQTNRAGRVVLEPLAHDGIDAGAAFAYKVLFARGEVVVAGPACDVCVLLENGWGLKLDVIVRSTEECLRVVRKLNPLRRSLW